MPTRGAEDIRRLTKMLFGFDLRTRNSLMEAGHVCAAGILEASWPSVEKVVQALLAKEPSEEGLRVLTGNEAKAILGYPWS